MPNMVIAGANTPLFILVFLMFAEKEQAINVSGFEEIRRELS